MARGIAYALGENGIAKLVKSYFTVNPVLSPSDLNVRSFDIFEGDSLTFKDLLKEILKTKGTTDLLLVIHGYTDGTGLALPLAPGAIDTKGRYLDMLMKINASQSDPTSNQMTQMGIDKAASLQIIELMKKVQAMSLNMVEWRSCDLGKSPAALEQFRQFFGATRMAAPTLESIFGASTVEYRSMDKIPDQKGVVAYSYPDKFNPTVSNDLPLDESARTPVAGKLIAANESDLNAWIKKYINASGAVHGKSVLVHSLWKDPDSDHPLDNPRPILPLESDFAKNITITP